MELSKKYFYIKYKNFEEGRRVYSESSIVSLQEFHNFGHESSCDISLESRRNIISYYAPPVSLPSHCPPGNTFLNFADTLCDIPLESPVTTISYYGHPMLLPPILPPWGSYFSKFCCTPHVIYIGQPCEHFIKLCASHTPPFLFVPQGHLSDFC